MIKINNITKLFPVYDNQIINDQIRDNQFYALDDVSINIEEGECTIIAGANGSGKSLLMSIIAALEKPNSGIVECRARVGLVFQEPDAQILGETPREDIAFGPRNMGLSKAECISRVDAALAATGLTYRADFPSRSLSGGEKRRLATAGVLAMDAQVIIFDEPYANLDYPGALQVNSLFDKLINDGKTLIILTHELEKCFSFAKKFIVLYKGKKVFDGLPSEAARLEMEAWGIRNPFKNNYTDFSFGGWDEDSRSFSI